MYSKKESSFWSETLVQFQVNFIFRIVYCFVVSSESGLLAQVQKRRDHCHNQVKRMKQRYFNVFICQP